MYKSVYIVTLMIAVHTNQILDIAKAAVANHTAMHMLIYTY